MARISPSWLSMAPVGDHRLQHPAQQRRQFDVAQPGRSPVLQALHHGLRSRCLGQLGNQVGNTTPHPPARSRPLQHAGDCIGGIEPFQPPRNVPGGQEVCLQEARERFADPVLRFRDDRRVRDGNAHRVAEQRRHRKPVGKATHQCCFGKGLHPHPLGVQGLDRPGGPRQQQGHHHKETGRNPPQANGLLGARRYRQQVGVVTRQLVAPSKSALPVHYQLRHHW
jgi:hypothetical protein